MQVKRYTHLIWTYISKSALASLQPSRKRFCCHVKQPWTFRNNSFQSFSLTYNCNENITVLLDWESTKPRLWSKLALSNTSWQILKVLKQLSPPNQFFSCLRALQWGTVWPYTQRGIKNTTGQYWKFCVY